MAKNKCPRCSELIYKEDIILCTGECKAFYHYICAGLSESSYKKLTQDLKNIFICVNCKSAAIDLQLKSSKDKRKGKQTLFNNDLQKKSESQSEIQSDILVGESKDWQKSLRQEILQMRIDLADDIKKLFLNFQESIKLEIADINKTVADNKSQIQHLQNKLDFTENKNKQIEEQNNDLRVILKSLDSELRIAKRDINQLNQFTRKNNLQINGIIESPNENLGKILDNLSKLLEQDKNEVIEMHRVASKFKPVRPIIIKFSRSAFKKNWLTQAKKMTITNQQVTGIASEQKIFFLEHLSEFNKKLHFEVKKIASRSNYRYTWIKNGQIFTRKSPESQVLRITCIEDLDKIT